VRDILFRSTTLDPCLAALRYVGEHVDIFDVADIADSDIVRRRRRDEDGSTGSGDQLHWLKPSGNAVPPLSNSFELSHRGARCGTRGRRPASADRPVILLHLRRIASQLTPTWQK
jgi:hypothetical protein